MSTKRKAITKLFPLELQKAMHGHSTKAQLADQMTKQKIYPVTRSYVGLIANGARPANPEIINAMCEALGAPKAVKVRLHRSAAIDVGYEIGTVDG